eukprot:SAG11_NODE_396_length_9806_cov_37.601855_9_plen_75_part_00
MEPEAFVLWHQRDLRIHDNALYDGIACNDSSSVQQPLVLPLYVFEHTQFTRHESVVERCALLDRLCGTDNLETL